MSSCILCIGHRNFKGGNVAYLHWTKIQFCWLRLELGWYLHRMALCRPTYFISSIDWARDWKPRWNLSDLGKQRTTNKTVVYMWDSVRFSEKKRAFNFIRLRRIFIKITINIYIYLSRTAGNQADFDFVQLFSRALRRRSWRVHNTINAFF